MNQKEKRKKVNMWKILDEKENMKYIYILYLYIIYIT